MFHTGLGLHLRALAAKFSFVASFLSLGVVPTWAGVYGLKENHSYGFSCWFFWVALRSILLGEWRHLVQNQGVDLVQHWGDSTLIWPFCWMVASGLGSRCGPRPALGGLNLELSDNFVEWWYLVKDHDMDPIQCWRDSTLSWVTILLNGDIWSRTRMWNQSSTGRLSLDLSSHSFEWRHLVSYQDSARALGPFSCRMEALGLLPSIWPSVKLCSLWLRHLVCYQEDTISPRLGLGMCDTLTLN